MKIKGLEEYHALVADLREGVRKGTLEGKVNRTTAENHCCFFCFDEPSTFIVTKENQEYPVGENCYQKAKTKVYIDGQPQDVN